MKNRGQCLKIHCLSVAPSGCVKKRRGDVVNRVANLKLFRGGGAAAV